MNSFSMSDHASRRLYQRAIRPADFLCFLAHADWESRQRNGSSAIGLTNSGASEALEAGIDPDTIRRIRSLCAIVDGSNVVTEYRGRPRRRQTLRRGDRR